MKNKKPLQLTNELIKIYLDFANKRWNKLRDTGYNAIYARWDTDSWYGFEKLFFNLVTGEEDFERFYSRFDAPGSSHGQKPIAWDLRFIPDMINDLIWDTELPLENKVKKIEVLYKKCVELEKRFKRKNK